MTKEKLIAELTEKLNAGARLRARLPPADREPHSDAQHRHPRAGRRQDSRRQSRRAAGRRPSRSRTSCAEIPGAAGVAPRACRASRTSKSSGPRGDGALRSARKDVLDVVEAGLGGKNVTTTIEGRQRFPIQVRARTRRARRHRAARRAFSIADARQVQPSRSARSRRSGARSGPSEIASENGRCASSCRPTCRTATSAASSRK